MRFIDHLDLIATALCKYVAVPLFALAVILFVIERMAGAA